MIQADLKFNLQPSQLRKTNGARSYAANQCICNAGNIFYLTYSI
jgi:hypothetical protein